MEGFGLIILAVGMFIFVVLALVIIILFAKSKLVASGHAKIIINDDPEKALDIPVGDKLLNAMADKKIYVPSACGGGGTCGECRLIIKQGGGDILSTERAQLTRRPEREGYRLSCQVPVKGDMKIEVPPEIFDIKKWEGTVRPH